MLDADQDGDGQLDIDEFIELVTKLREMLNMKPLPEAKARKQFKKLDGTISTQAFGDVR